MEETNELIRTILYSYGEDMIKEKDKYKGLFCSIFNTDTDTFDDFTKDLEEVLNKEKEKHENMNEEKDYKEAMKKVQEATKEYKAMKDKEKENPTVYIPFVCDLSMSISGLIDDDLDSSINVLGVFTDPKMAERQCEMDINANDDDWKVLRDLPTIYNEKPDLAYKVYRSKYFFDHEFMVLEVKFRIIFKTRLNDLNTNLTLSSSELIDQHTHDMLIDIFNNFKNTCDKLLIDVEDNIDNLLEERYKCEWRENKGEDKCERC